MLIIFNVSVVDFNIPIVKAVEALFSKLKAFICSSLTLKHILRLFLCSFSNNLVHNQRANNSFYSNVKIYPTFKFEGGSEKYHVKVCMYVPRGGGIAALRPNIKSY